MSRPSYDGRRFAAVATDPGGDVDASTVFHYHQDGDTVWATYQGGAVRRGTLVATADAEGCLDMRYAHVDATGALRTGSCRTVPETLPDGRLRLHETWQWTDGPGGTSTLDELLPGT